MNKIGEGKSKRTPLLVVIGLMIIAGVLLVITNSTTENLSHAESSKLTNRPAIANSVAALKQGRTQLFREEGTAEERVASRLKEFTKSRREIAARYAEKLGITLTPEVGTFFDLAEAGDFAELEQLWKKMEQHRGPLEGMRPLLHETFGVHEQVSKWPAEALLDYGTRILANVVPGSIYLGGTDAGRFIPTLLNETGSSPNHIILTQNAFADNSYLDYVNFIYADRFVPFAPKDSQEAFGKYLQDAKRRLEHDQKFPNEPKQVRDGENISMADGRIQISGAVSVTAINESILQMFRAANPELSIAMEESQFNMPSTYEGATTKGSLIWLDAQGNVQPITPAVANNTISFWKDTVNRLEESPELLANETVGKAYAHMLVAHGNLFQSQKLLEQAEAAFRLGQQLAPSDPRPTFQLAALLTQTGRQNEGMQIMNAWQAAHK